DMVFLGHSSSANKFIEGIKGKEKMIFLMKKAKHVIVCTPKLAEYVSQYNKELTDISSTINTETYKGKNLYNNQNPLTIGWSGSHSTSKYLRLITDILKELQEQYKIKILVIGDASFTAPGLEIESINWNAATEVENLQRIDIGVYPLPNEDWVYGKSGLKALQYMALGIPTVATAIGANFRIIENEETGFLVNTKEEWKEKLELLCNNPELRKKIGMAAALKVEKEYSIKANAPLYLDALKKVTSV
ncbi:MAG: glycosyltransferase family 4 protein, partial [Bacteroidia bacterium]|nr:glycosyltransferase family 4 protein [Bacteroidia bacterium]